MGESAPIDVNGGDGVFLPYSILENIKVENLEKCLRQTARQYPMLSPDEIRREVTDYMARRLSTLISRELKRVVSLTRSFQQEHIRRQEKHSQKYVVEVNPFHTLGGAGGARRASDLTRRHYKTWSHKFSRHGRHGLWNYITDLVKHTQLTLASGVDRGIDRGIESSYDKLIRVCRTESLPFTEYIMALPVSTIAQIMPPPSVMKRPVSILPTDKLLTSLLHENNAQVFYGSISHLEMIAVEFGHENIHHSFAQVYTHQDIAKGEIFETTTTFGQISQYGICDMMSNAFPEATEETVIQVTIVITHGVVDKLQRGEPVFPRLDIKAADMRHANLMFINPQERTVINYEPYHETSIGKFLFEHFLSTYVQRVSGCQECAFSSFNHDTMLNLGDQRNVEGCQIYERTITGVCHFLSSQTLYFLTESPLLGILNVNDAIKMYEVYIYSVALTVYDKLILSATTTAEKQFVIDHVFGLQQCVLNEITNHFGYWWNQYTRPQREAVFWHNLSRHPPTSSIKDKGFVDIQRLQQPYDYQNYLQLHISVRQRLEAFNFNVCIFGHGGTYFNINKTRFTYCQGYQWTVTNSCLGFFFGIFIDCIFVKCVISPVKTRFTRVTFDNCILSSSDTFDETVFEDCKFIGGTEKQPQIFQRSGLTLNFDRSQK